MRRSASLANTLSTIDAGDFGLWLAQVRASFQGNAGTEVPCGDCRGCCTASYFIHVRPEDSCTRAVVPKRLLSSAPGLPSGHQLIGFASDGSCPLLQDRMCSIYQHRPQTCRDYDCRVFAAAGIDAGGADKAAINQRVWAWQFSYATEQDVRVHAAVKAAAAFIQTHGASFPGGRVPRAPSDIAVLAIKVHTVFLQPQIQDQAPAATAQAIIVASRAFEASSPTVNG